MKILITGGNGFLGKNTAEFLLKENHKVMILSRNCNNLEYIFNKVQFLKTDSDYSHYEEEILKFSPDVTIHFAWDGGNNRKDSNGLNQIYKNITNSVYLLEILGKLKHKTKFIGVGCFGEYGDIFKQATEDQIESPTTFYGLSKNIFKNISNMYCKQNSIEWAWIRPCYIYGYGDVSTRLIPSVINNLLQNKKIELDMCNKTIDYLHVYDFCTAISSILESHDDGIINICSGKEYNLKNIIIFIENTIKNYKLIHYNSNENNNIYVCGSNLKLKSKTLWTPTINIEDGIISTIERYKNEKLNRRS
jgi:nucleoside-diphosphate-sugar epimerase